jgi:hypothetical protein
MKVLAIVLVLAGLVISIAPQFTNCEAHRGTMPMASAAAGGAGSAAQAPAVPRMKCLWTARAGIAVGATLAVVGVLLFLARRKETRRALGIVAALLGVLTILLPKGLIGTCPTDSAVCNTTMTPIMLAVGGLAAIVGIIVVIFNEMSRETPPPGASS